MARDRSPPRRTGGGRGGDHRKERERRDDDREYHRSGRRGDRRDGRGDSRRDQGRLTPPRDSRELFPDGRGSYSPQEGRLSRPDDIPHPRRDRSNDRKRERERSPDRHRGGAGRNRSRERYRDGRGYRDDSRERKRLRRSDSAEDRRRSGRDRDDSRDRRPYKSRREQEEDAARAAEVEEKRAKEELQQKQLKRQAKVAELKKRKAAEAAVTSRPVSVGNDAVSITSPVPVESNGASPVSEVEASKPFTGKFDPKAIAKRAAMAKSRLEHAALGQDATIGPEGLSHDLSNIKESAPLGGALRSTKNASKAIAKGFGSNHKDNVGNTTTESSAHVDMDDDATKKRKLDKLPLADLPDGEAASPQDSDDDEGDFDAFGDTEEEQAAAARAAAEKRAAISAMDGVQQTQRAQDVQMNLDEEEEDVDPLDAFMSELSTGPKRKSTNRTNRLLEAEVEFGDDDVVDAVGSEDERVALAAQKKKNKKKDIPLVNHDKVKYEPFRKEFFTEPLELQEMSDADVKSLRFELDDIKVQGSKVPKPVQKFAQFGLGTHVLEVIRGLGFEKPTSIQAQAIPAIMSGRDVIGVAKTGSGKTVAFLLPMFRHIKDQRPLENLEGPIGLILAPTRELTTQIYEECKPYLKAMHLRAVCAYGGSPITEQIAALKRGAEIVVCTPGRLIDLLGANSGRVINLRRVTYIVMDEADRMFDMGFEPQVTKVLSNIRPDRQCVLFSATFPRKMEALARQELHEPVQITVGGRSSVPKEITQVVEIISEDKKLGRLLKLIGDELLDEDDKRVLVFVERQDTADMLLVKLQRTGYPCVSVHGGREQHDRDDALNDFKAGNVPIMIATSVAARGLDVKQLTLVVNYDVPSHMEDYVHRCGRTGRAGNKGTAVTFITPQQDRQSLDIIKAMTYSETPIPPELQELADRFSDKVKDGSEKRFGSGFGGHGLDRLNAQHEAELKRQRLRARLEGQMDGEDDDEEVEEKKEDKPPEAEIKVLAKGETAPPAGVAPATVGGIPDSILNGEIKVERYEKPERTKLNVTGATRLDRAAAAAALINSRLGAGGTARAGASVDNRGPDAGEFHYKLEINDFPQKARWAVTNRTNVAKILESTGVSITTKGRFYKAGEDPGPGDLPKMNVLVEGDTEVQVTTAVRELQRLLREAQMEADTSTSRVGGRYTVV